MTSRWCKCSKAPEGKTPPLTFTAWHRLPIGTSWPHVRISLLSCWARVEVARPLTANTSSNIWLLSLEAPTGVSPVCRKQCTHVINVVRESLNVTAFSCLVCSGEMAGGLLSFGGFWKCLYLYEWECQSLLPHCFFGLWPGRPGNLSFYTGTNKPCKTKMISFHCL